jgi:ADP-heptose:LPS heptosyltransferase
VAHTWPVTRGKRAALGVVDAVGYAVSAPLRWLRKAPPDPGFIRRILVIEPWNIGDVVLATPLLAELRRRFPKASITLLAKAHAKEILRESGLIDDVVECDLAWTRSRGKYRLSSADAKALVEVVRKLRRGKFDVTLDARADPRSNLLAAAAGAHRRIGYDLGGGWLLTDALATDPDKHHKIVDWLRLLGPLGGRPAPAPGRVISESQVAEARGELVTAKPARPLLRVSEEEVAEARQALAAGGALRRPLVGYHPGGSHPGKRWPLERFAELSGMISARFGGSVVVFAERSGYGRSGPFPEETVFVETGLRGLMASLKCCDVVVCNDSGPMHLADGLGVPVVAIFESGNPQWYGPSGPSATVVKGKQAGTGISARPAEFPPQNPVAVQTVYSAAAKLLRDLGFERESG